jgi:hypothetical protein
MLQGDTSQTGPALLLIRRVYRLSDLLAASRALSAICQQTSLATPCAAGRRLHPLMPTSWDDVVQSMAPTSSEWGPHSLHTAEVSASLAMASRSLGGQQPGSTSNRTRLRETPRITATALVLCPVMQGFMGAGLPGFLDGMQGVRGSNPLSSTRHNVSPTFALSAVRQRFARNDASLCHTQHRVASICHGHTAATMRCNVGAERCAWGPRSLHCDDLCGGAVGV